MARMKPKSTDSKITKVKVGWVWTTITLRISTPHILRTTEKHYGRALAKFFKN